jgi:CRP/FNR family transcriptional regulator, cyclic AMP receptor protein
LVETLFILKRGRVRLFRVSADGRALTTAILSPGTIFGEMVLLGQRMYDNYAEALDGAVVCVMRRSDVQRFLLSDPRIAARITAILGQRLVDMERRLSDTVFKCVPQRIATTLATLAGRERRHALSARTPVVALTHEQLAALAYAGTLVVLAFGAAGAHRLLRAAAEAVERRHADPREHDEHERVLHDTALATLTAIARGGLDLRADQVRARCARDAAYLRLMVQGGRLDLGSLPVALAAAAEEAAAVGLRVHPTSAPLPSDLDPAVVEAIARAVREALNNVHRHARTGEAWLTAAVEGGRVVVRVVDRGVGFTPARADRGSGIRDSICRRMRQVGGAALVESAPAQGTCVEPRWPE